MFKMIAVILLGLLIACHSDTSKTHTVSTKKQVDTVAYFYKPLISYNKDTLAYLHENFVQQKAYYQNKKFAQLLDNFHLPIKFVTWNLYEPNLNLSSGIDIYIYTNKQLSQQKKRHGNPKILYVKFVKMIELASAAKVSKTERDEHGDFVWGPKQELFYRGFIIEDIKLSNYNYK